MADTKIHHQNKPNNPSRFYSHFLYKALAVTIFLVILPIFPSQAPDFISQTLNTRGWEFLHLIFVGIAVSYGLFSRRNDESEKDNIGPSKFDNAQSYVSKFLQVSSVFDDEVDSPGPDVSGDPGPGSSRCDGVGTVQTWNNQYYRNDPVVVVADQNSVLHQDQKMKISDSRVGEKPLLLPVRSLKSRVFDADAMEESFNSLSRSNSNLSCRRNLEENLKNNLVLPSPIPWRSRSGRMELKEAKQEQPNSPTLFSPASSSMEESEFNRSLKAQTSRVSRSDSTTSSPKLSSSPNKFSIETQGKCAEDFVRKKSIYRSPPPPPPPPPPPTRPHLIRKSKTTKPIDDEIFSPRRSFTSEPKSVRSSDHQSSVRTEKLNRDRVSFMLQPMVMEFPKEDKEESVEKFVVESEEDFETEEDDEIETDSFVSVPSGGGGDGGGGGGSGSSDGGPDVDKKADEFIAKFREQIRLQRIESIKRSSGQINRKIKR